MGMAVKRFDVFLVSLDPTVGGEIKKTRPCVVISPDEMNRHIRTVLIAPMTTKGRRYPTRVECSFKRKTGQIALEQMRGVDVARLVKKRGRLDKGTSDKVLTVLQEMFAP